MTWQHRGGDQSGLVGSGGLAPSRLTRAKPSPGLLWPIWLFMTPFLPFIAQDFHLHQNSQGTCGTRLFDNRLAIFYHFTLENDHVDSVMIVYI